MPESVSECTGISTQASQQCSHDKAVAKFKCQTKGIGAFNECVVCVKVCGNVRPIYPLRCIV